MDLWRPTRPSRINTHKYRCYFHHRGLECKSRKSRDTFNNGQVWPWSTKSSRERLTEFCQENTLVIANTLFQQQKRRLYTWTSPDGQYRKQIDYILFSQRWRIFIWSAKTRPGDSYGSDHELLIAKLRLKLKKVQKTNRLGKTNRLFIIRSSLDDTTLMEDTEEELKSLLTRVKEESENLAWNLTSKKTKTTTTKKPKIMVSGHITSCHIEEEKVKSVTFYFLGHHNHCGWLLQTWK